MQKELTVKSGGATCYVKLMQLSAEGPLVVMATGGSKRGSQSSTWQRLPGYFAQRGVSSLVFDFPGQGNSTGDRRDLTIRRGVDCLFDVLTFAATELGLSENRLSLLGSSYGGNVVIEFLALSPTIMVRGASLKSPCIDLRESYFQELGEEGMRRWKEAGYLEATGLDWKVMEEVDRDDLARRLPTISVPLLITHGTDDESVPLSQSRQLRDGVSGVVDLIEMKGTNHHYSDRDDWERMAMFHAAWHESLFQL